MNQTNQTTQSGLEPWDPQMHKYNSNHTIGKEKQNYKRKHGPHNPPGAYSIAKGTTRTVFLSEEHKCSLVRSTPCGMCIFFTQRSQQYDRGWVCSDSKKTGQMLEGQNPPGIFLSHSQCSNMSFRRIWISAPISDGSKPFNFNKCTTICCVMCLFIPSIITFLFMFISGLRKWSKLIVI